MADAQRPQLRGGVLAGAGVMLLLALLSSRPLLAVPAGHRAVVFNVFSGVEKSVRGEGLHLLIPFVESATLYSVQTQTYTMSATKEDKVDVDPYPLTALTKDGQLVNLDLTVTFHPAKEQLPQLFQHLGREHLVVEKIVRPELRALSRMVVAQYTVTDVYGAKRQELETAITERLRAAFQQNFLVLENVMLRNVAFSAAFQQAIEKKQVAQQNLEKMEYVLQQARTDKQRAIVEGHGQADALKLVAESLSRNPQLVQYEYVKNLNPSAQSVVMSSKAIVNLGDLLEPHPAAATDDSSPAKPSKKGK